MKTANELVREAQNTRDALQRRFDKVDLEFRKTSAKQITKFAFISAKHQNLKKLVEMSERRVARRLSAAIGIVKTKAAKVKADYQDAVEIKIYCSICNSTERGVHSASCLVSKL